MLSCLRVRHFAIIDELEVEFGKGFNVVTGETGAGKSILVDALQLVLGGRSSPELVRQGAEQAIVEALFSIAANNPTATRCVERGLLNDADTASSLHDATALYDLVLRRLVPSNGRSRAYVNGQLTSATELSDISTGLADISSQHEHHALVDAANHLQYLDAFAQVTALRRTCTKAYEALSEHRKQCEALAERQRQRLQREELLRFQLEEIRSVHPLPGEDETLQTERTRLRHAERLIHSAGSAEAALYADDGALCTLLARVASDLRSAAAIDVQLAPLVDQLDGARTQLEDAGRELGAYARSLHLDTERLRQVDERLERLERLKRKHGGSLQSVIDYGEGAESELRELEDAETRQAELQAGYDDALQTAAIAARQLRAERQQAAGELSARITAELVSLGMGDAKVVVEVAALEGRSDEICVDGARLSPSGTDRVEFLIAPNRGEVARPLAKIASGGELSRAMLAIKRVLAGLGPASLYVFDEVDAGVGGAVAEVIGRKLHSVAQHHQVICITHLPQIAVYADAHYQVRKEVVNERTQSSLVRLNDTERLDEIARMLGGVKVSDKTRAAAAEMLRDAHRATDGQHESRVASEEVVNKTAGKGQREARGAVNKPRRETTGSLS